MAQFKIPRSVGIGSSALLNLNSQIDLGKYCLFAYTKNVRPSLSARCTGGDGAARRPYLRTPSPATTAARISLFHLSKSTAPGTTLRGPSRRD
jgi:hypothetical protein